MKSLRYTAKEIAHLKSYANLYQFCTAKLGKPERLGGGKVFFPCPYSDQHQRSKLELREHEGIGYAKCWACDRDGTVIDIAAHLLGLDARKDFTRILDEVARVVGVAARAPEGEATRPQAKESTISQAKAWECVERAQASPDVLLGWAERLHLPLEALQAYTCKESPRAALLGLDNNGRLAYMYTSLDSAGAVYFTGVKLRALPHEKSRFTSWKGSKPASLWGALSLQDDTATVIITEGESDALALLYSLRCWAEQSPEHAAEGARLAVVAKPSASTFSQEWAHRLKGLDVILTVDADEAGKKGATQTIKKLRDAGVGTIYTWQAQGVAKDPRDAFDAQNPSALLADVLTAKELAEAATPAPSVQIPIIPLGEEGKLNVYWSQVNNRLYRLSANEHTSKHLLRMAKLQDFAQWLYPHMDEETIQKSRRVILDTAGDRLLELTAGMSFDSSRVRARGVWVDSEAGEIIYNAGNACYLCSADAPTPQLVDKVRGRYIYDAGTALPHPSAEPLTDKEGASVVQFLEARTWDMPHSGELLAGWLVCGMLAGALPFRPHVWVNAPANTGKTYLRDDILRILGAVAVPLDGAESTEAALRAELNGAALPVVWDELEQDSGDRRKESNIERIVALIRNATKGGVIKKAVIGGGAAKTYEVRAAFMLFSIAHSLKKDSDMSRFLCLRLRKASNTAIAAITTQQREGRELIAQSSFQPRLISRLLQQYPFIMRNIAKVEAYLNERGHAPRRCEMLAALLAGSHALGVGGDITPALLAHADEVATSYSERDEQQQSDSQRALETLLAHPITVKGRQLRLGQLVEIEHDYLNGIAPDEFIEERTDAYAILNGYGLGWHISQAPSDKGAQYLRILPKMELLKPAFLGSAFQNRPLVPLFMEVGKKGDISPIGILCKNVRLSTPTKAQYTASACINPYAVESSPSRQRQPVTCLLVPSALIFPDEVQADEAQGQD